VRLNPWTARIASLWRSRRYDRMLAGGCAVDRCGALAHHAQRIIARAERDAIQLLLMKILLDAVRGQSWSASNVHRSNIFAAQGLLRQVVQKLHSSLQVTPWGMARLRLLVFDWDGPLYANGGGDLEARLNDIINVL
jgi:hypothetical protein